MDLQKLKRGYLKAQVEDFNGIEVVAVNKKHLEWFIQQAEKVEEQERILQFINKVAFEITKHQRKLNQEGSDKFNEELLDFAWSTNDIISDRK